MRHVTKHHSELGDIDIASIDLSHRCRDDMPALLTGLQHLYGDKELRSRLFACTASAMPAHRHAGL